jgi:hypothetical protein
MRPTLLTVVAVFVLLLMTSPALAVGEAGAISLTIPPGARANGIGGSFVALADDATSAWWNAGGLAFVKGRHLGLMHSQLVPDLDNDVYYEFLGYTNEFEGLGTMSIAVVYLTYGTSEGRDNNNNPTGTFKSWEGSVLASFAMPLSENLGVGVTGKFFHADFAPADLTLEKIDGSGSTVALDAGVLWKLPTRNLRLGASLTNLGPDISYINQNQSDPLPISLRIGAAYQALSDEVSHLVLSVDVEQSLVWLISSAVKTRAKEIYHGGIEYRYINLLAGRIGYVYDQDGDFKDATYGLGFIYSNKVSFDYANVPQATTLDRVHRWSVAVSF